MKRITRIGIGGPVGSGKTAIVEAITPRLIEQGARILVITNDVVTTEDAKHVQRTLKGILIEERILGVETGACPHTAVREDPSMNLAAVEDMEARFPDTDVVLIESGGDNLTLTFSPALVDYFIYVIDVAAGDKIPRKNGPGITQSDILVINKTDLAPYVGASLEVMEHDSRLMRGKKPFVFTNCKTGAGIDRLIELVREGVLFDLNTTRQGMSYFDQARELDPYRDEPKQLPSGAPGKNALLKLRFEARDQRSELVYVDRRAPLIVQRALYWDEAMPQLPCVFVITNSGGILQGDRYRIEIELGPDSQAHITTQAAAKIHEMDANFAAQTQVISLAERAYLEYLPDPMIPHRHSRFITRTLIRLVADATLLYAEILMPGRKYYQQGELFEFDLFSSLVRAERTDGEELFVEKFIIEPCSRDVRAGAVIGPYDVFGNVLLLTTPEHTQQVASAVPAVIDQEQSWAGGMSRLPNNAGLVYKIVGMETEVVRRKVREFWAIVRREVTGHELMPDFAWR